MVLAWTLTPDRNVVQLVKSLRMEKWRDGIWTNHRNKYEYTITVLFQILCPILVVMVR